MRLSLTARAFLTGLLALFTFAGSARSQAPAPGSDAARLVGIWRLVSITTDGKVNPARGGKPTGYIFYTSSGHMGAHIQPERAPIGIAGKAPSEAEAKATLVGYTAYWGTYKIDEKTKVVTHQRYGSVQPGTEVDAFRAYRFETNDRVVLGGVGTTNQNTWERIRDEPGSAGDAQRFVGVWKLVSITEDGKVNPLRGATPTGFIFYTSTGEMSAMIQPDRSLMKMAGKEPSGPEAQAALKGFTAYFGTFTVDEKSKVVSHHRKANVQPGGDAVVQRSYKFLPDNRVSLGAVGGKSELIWESVK
jgi:hypothetical protein